VLCRVSVHRRSFCHLRSAPGCRSWALLRSLRRQCALLRLLRQSLALLRLLCQSLALLRLDERSSDVEVLGIAEGIGVVKLVVVVVVVVIMSADSIGVVEELVVVVIVIVIMSAGSIGIVEELVVVLRSLVSSVGKRGIWVVGQEVGNFVEGNIVVVGGCKTSGAASAAGGT
jgi:hypothetical protein